MATNNVKTAINEQTHLRNESIHLKKANLLTKWCIILKPLQDERNASRKEGKEHIGLLILVPALHNTDKVDAVPNDRVFDFRADRTV